MHLLFFQNCISPHQMPYIEALARLSEVSLIRVIAPRGNYDERASMGWTDPLAQGDGSASPKLQVAVDPSIEQVRRWLKEAVAAAQGAPAPVCFFSGISAFPEVYEWFRASLKFDVRRAVITEAPFTFQHPMWMHRVRFALRDWRYVRRVHFVFAIGQGCADYYAAWSKRWKVVPFLYCTQGMTDDLQKAVESCKLRSEREAAICRIAFVGAIDRRKNVGLLIDALERMALENAGALRRCQITIVGDGPEREALQWRSREVGLSGTVRFVGVKPMAETQRLLAEQDYLVLPSLHDGWGAVINEALTLGVWPLCSDHCGARQVIEQDVNGQVFPLNDVPALTALLEDAVRRLPQVQASRDERIRWAEEHISPDAVARIVMNAIS